MSSNGQMPPADELDFGIVTGQHWRSWETILAQWRWAEETGWDSAWTFDHFFSLRPTDDGVCLEGWTLLAALAAHTERLRLGTLVTGITHRNPAVLFKQAVTVDHISGGRLILGVGAAWNEPEHEAYGIPFPSPGTRVDMFTEAMEMNRLLETQERTTFEGEHYTLKDAPFVPKPVSGHIPVMIGTSGKRMLANVARYADYWDAGQPADKIPGLWEQVERHCTEIGRDPASIRKSISAYFAPSSNPNAPIVQWDLTRQETEDAFREHVAAYVAVGVRTFLFNILYDAPNDNLEHVARNVIPEMREAFKRGELG